ncbi:hypothetical protein C8R44DRAFT_787524 [Mycena epipterygia]|nr:hypothetical protein C8R44DRAFT_787524 [Mycena epipterygia]
MTDLLSVTQYTDSGFKPDSLPSICGGMALVRPDRQLARPDAPEVYEIIDFRAQKHCKIVWHSHIPANFAMELATGYLIFTAAYPPDKIQHIRICSIASLSESWTPLGDHNTADPMPVSNIPHVALTTIEVKGTTRRTTEITVLESPLQRDTYRVWLYIPQCASKNYDRLCGFRLSLPAAGGFSWQQHRCTPVEPPILRMRGVSYSGHTPEACRRFDLLQRIFGPHISPASINVAAELMVPDWGYVAPYSGALPYFTGPDLNTLVLCYFE